jgi:hypothetical protein
MAETRGRLDQVSQVAAILEGAGDLGRVVGRAVIDHDDFEWR